MNNIIKLFSLFFFILIASCSHDDREDIKVKNEGFLKIGDQTVELSQAYLENYGIRGNSYNIDFSARSNKLTGSANSAVVYFELFSSLENDLSKGNYNLGIYSDAIANTYTKWGQSLLGKDIKSDGEELSVTNGICLRPTSGTFTVSENGQFYEVSFLGKGSADNYTDGKLTSSQADIIFSMKYKGSVERYKNKGFTAKAINSKERPVKRPSAIYY